MTTRNLGGKGNRGRRSQKTSCRATTSRRPPTRYERSHTRKVNLCIIQVLLLTGLAILALLVSSLGVYGVLSYTVRQRTREIGLRMALGADPSQMLRMVLRQGFSIAAMGVATGIVAVAGLTRVLGSLLYGVEPLDGLTFALVAVVMMAAALLASYLPARQAAKLDPTAALRCD